MNCSLFDMVYIYFVGYNEYMRMTCVKFTCIGIKYTGCLFLLILMHPNVMKRINCEDYVKINKTANTVLSKISL